MLDEPLLRLRSLRKPAGDRRERRSRVARLAFALLKLAVLAAIRDQEVEQTDDSDSQQQPTDVNCWDCGGTHRPMPSNRMANGSVAHARLRLLLGPAAATARLNGASG